MRLWNDFSSINGCNRTACSQQNWLQVLQAVTRVFELESIRTRPESTSRRPPPRHGTCSRWWIDILTPNTLTRTLIYFHHHFFFILYFYHEASSWNVTNQNSSKSFNRFVFTKIFPKKRLSISHWSSVIKSTQIDHKKVQTVYGKM